jgi:hypothetical protein
MVLDSTEYTMQIKKEMIAKFTLSEKEFERKMF